MLVRIHASSCALSFVHHNDGAYDAQCKCACYITGTSRQPAEDPAFTQLHSYIQRHGAAGAIDTTHTRTDWRTTLPPPPMLAFTPARTYLWHIDTGIGQITVKLLPEVAPKHVSNFAYLSQLGYFDGLGFHRVIPAFMAQVWHSIILPTNLIIGTLNVSQTRAVWLSKRVHE
jgi:hypothetical protein